MSVITEGRKFRKYVLIDAIKSSAKYFLKSSPTSPDGIRLDTPRRVTLHLQNTIRTKDGKQKIIRYKQGVPSIFQDVQIKEHAIPANEKFTDHERRAMQFINGVLLLDGEQENEFVSKEYNPQHADFEGQRLQDVTPLFRELDEEALSKEENTFLRNTAKALGKIFTMDKVEVAALLALIYGAAYKVPASLDDAQNAAAKALEGNDEVMNLVIEWGADKDLDSSITIMLNQAIGKGIINFDLHPNQVSLLKNNEWRDVKMIAGDVYEEREMLFRQYLATPEGELLRKDIESIVADEPKEEAAAKKKK